MPVRVPLCNKKTKITRFSLYHNFALHCPHLFQTIFFLYLSCRRRLSSALVRLKFAEHLKEAATYIEQGHVRVGPETVTDPAFLVTRNMEDFITWVDSSKIKRKVLQYNDKLDDYDLIN